MSQTWIANKSWKRSLFAGNHSNSVPLKNRVRHWRVKIQCYCSQQLGILFVTDTWHTLGPPIPQPRTDFGRVPSSVLPPVPFGLRVVTKGHEEGAMADIEQMWDVRDVMMWRIRQWSLVMEQVYDQLNSPQFSYVYDLWDGIMSDFTDSYNIVLLGFIEKSIPPPKKATKKTNFCSEAIAGVRLLGRFKSACQSRSSSEELLLPVRG